MPTAPPPYQRARDTAPTDVGRLQAHFMSHRRTTLLDMHTVIQRTHRVAIRGPSQGRRLLVRSSSRTAADIGRDPPTPTQRPWLCQSSLRGRLDRLRLELLLRLRSCLTS